MKKMKLTALFLLLLSPLVLSSPCASAAKPEEPASAVVKNLYSHLTETMKQGEKLGFEGRYKKLEPVIKESFNLPLMARFAAGPAWREAGPEDREKLIESFSEFSIANYASRFKKFDGEKFTVLGEKPASGGGVIVETTLEPAGEKPVVLNYLLRKDEKGRLRIVDVFLDASISELATRRSEFGAIIKREGWPALISSLEEKTRKMGG